jgi:hypothetical protein
MKNCPYCNEGYTLEEQNTKLTNLTEKTSKTKLTDWLNVLCTAIIMLTGIFAFFIYRDQLQVMHGQLIQSERAMNHSIESSRLDQRAWVGPVDIVVSKLELGSPMELKVIIENSGKTPALNTTIFVRAKTLMKESDFIAAYETTDKNRSNYVIQPGVKTHVILDMQEKIIQSHVDILKSGDEILYVYGKLSYDDIFNRSHETTFCSYLATDLKSITACRTNNMAD